MACENIRERFSSFLEKELSPSEEEEFKGHLSSCPECQKEFKQFEKTMQWLHSMEEVEVPEGLLPGIYKTIEEHEKKDTVSGRVKWRSLSYPRSLKLPIQAAAMVTIVFLALYLTRMMPADKSSLLDLKDVEQAKAPRSDVTKAEKQSLPTETKEDKKVAELPSETRRKRDIEQVKALGSGETKLEGKFLPRRMEEAKGATAPSPKTEAMTLDPSRLKEMGKGKAALPEMGKEGERLIPQEEVLPVAKLPQEIILKISDRGKTLYQIYELVKHFEGEIVKTEENILHASLPVGSFPEFEKELVELSSRTKTDQVVARKELPEALSKAPEAKKKEVKEQELRAPLPEKEDRISVRILILQE